MSLVLAFFVWLFFCFWPLTVCSQQFHPDYVLHPPMEPFNMPLFFCAPPNVVYSSTLFWCPVFPVCTLWAFFFLRGFFRRSPMFFYPFSKPAYHLDVSCLRSLLDGLHSGFFIQICLFFFPPFSLPSCLGLDVIGSHHLFFTNSFTKLRIFPCMFLCVWSPPVSLTPLNGYSCFGFFPFNPLHVLFLLPLTGPPPPPLRVPHQFLVHFPDPSEVPFSSFVFCFLTLHPVFFPLNHNNGNIPVAPTNPRDTNPPLQPQKQVQSTIFQLSATFFFAATLPALCFAFLTLFLLLDPFLDYVPFSPLLSLFFPPFFYMLAVLSSLFFFPPHDSGNFFHFSPPLFPSSPRALNLSTHTPPTRK